MQLSRVDDKSLLVTYAQVEEGAPSTETTFLRLRNVGKKETSVELVCHLEVGGGSKVVNSRKHLDIINKIATYFSNLIPSEEANKKDGKQFGEDLMLVCKEREDGKTKEEAVKKFVAENASLKGVAGKYPFVEAMLSAIIENKLHRMRKVEGAAKDLKEKEGK